MVCARRQESSGKHRHGRSDCALRCSRWRYRHGSRAGKHRSGRSARDGMVKTVSGAVLHRGAARRRASDRELYPCSGQPRGTTRAAGRRHASGPVHAARGILGARGAGVHCRRLRARGPTPAKDIYPGELFQEPGRDGRTVRGSARGTRQFGGNRQALQSGTRSGQEQVAAVSRPRGNAARGLFVQSVTPRTGIAARLAFPGPRGARGVGAGLRRKARVRTEDHHSDGIRRLLSHRRRLHQLGQSQWRSRGPRARFRGRVACGLRAGDYRSRSAALRPAFRAFSQPRAGVDAGFRHRLLPRRTRPRDRLRKTEIRPRFGVADFDFRHHGGKGRGARRRTRARVGLRPDRRTRQADSVSAWQDRDIEAPHRQGGQGNGVCARSRTANRRSGSIRRGNAAAARPGDAAGRTGAQRRHACRRSAHRSGQTHRLLPALCGGRLAQRGVATGQGRR